MAVYNARDYWVFGLGPLSGVGIMMSECTSIIIMNTVHSQCVLEHNFVEMSKLEHHVSMPQLKASMVELEEAAVARQRLGKRNRYLRNNRQIVGAEFSTWSDQRLYKEGTEGNGHLRWWLDVATEEEESRSRYKATTSEYNSENVIVISSYVS
jgi:hypothetical protein